MSAQKFGSEYLKSYPGILQLVEEVLNISVLVAGLVCGFTFKTIVIFAVSLFALLTTGIFLIINYRSLFKRSIFPWGWVECANCLSIALMYLLGSSIAISELSRDFIVTGVIGYITSMVYILETIDKFKLAVTPRARYVWTTPNMPE